MGHLYQKNVIIYNGDVYESADECKKNGHGKMTYISDS
jgi:hypothetical protein